MESQKQNKENSAEEIFKNKYGQESFKTDEGHQPTDSESQSQVA